MFRTYRWYALIFDDFAMKIKQILFGWINGVWKIVRRWKR